MGRSSGGSERQESVSSILGTEIIHVAVGAEQREFAIHRKLLETSSEYFTELIATSMPLQLQPDLFCPWNGFSAAPSVRMPFDSEAYSVWLAAESPTMFELFVLWLYQRSAGLTKIVDEATAFGAVGSRPGAAGGKIIGNKCKALNLHWNLARLHVFAAKAGIDELQDIALDCLQDVFARCDWTVTPKFVRFVYERCDPDQAFRLRKWTVAMLAWTLATKDVDLKSLCPGMADGEESRDDAPASPSSTSESSRSSKSPRHQQQQQQSIPPIARRFSAMLVDTPDLLGDFSDHVLKLSKLRGSVSLKNPSMRLPSNLLKSEERQYGFRMCSFHSHRRDVGQGTCPHRLSIASRTPAPSAMPPTGYNFNGGGGGISPTYSATARGFSENGRSRSRSGSRRTKSRGSGSDTSSSSSSSDLQNAPPYVTASGPLAKLDTETEF